MAPANWFRSSALLVLGAILGGLFVSSWEHPAAVAQQNNPQAAPPTMADVAHLKDITPPFSHPMVDVAMFAANLWFAGDKKNWPLANYYLGEMRNRLGWEVRLNPSPKGADGNPVDMKNIFDGIDTGSLTKLKTIIDRHERQQAICPGVQELAGGLLFVSQNRGPSVYTPHGSDCGFATYCEPRPRSHVAAIATRLRVQGWDVTRTNKRALSVC